MRSILRHVAAACLAVASLHAQPQVGYILPDIGAEGMNTAVEIVAPADARGTFGPDGLSLNAPGDRLRVQPSAADAGKVVVGPLVVSWEGRLISTQIFVPPGVSYRGSVTLEITLDGRTTTDRSFSIVDPQNLGSQGTLSGGGLLGSGGPFGTRSPRGAMIVDSLTLTGGTFGVSTADPDGDPTNGNQGYLPFILIARGPVVVDGVLNVNAQGSDGGAGGGGGGGNLCDGSAGGAGGAGFSGGGAGGARGGAFAADGAGSGPGGRSLNGVAAGGDGRPGCTTPNGAGGGSGHPFGMSGAGYCAGSSPAGDGGSANAPGAGGGGGGNATAGGGGSGGGGAVGGAAVGNPQGVPVAGGSGGAGGATVGAGCGAFGGGGGGALVISSMERITNNFRLNAAGGNATSGSGGGGGAGGFISLAARSSSSLGGRIFASGGLGNGTGGAGGDGRLRYDGFAASAPTPSPASSIYIGPSLDTLTSVDSRLFTLKGTGSGSDSVRIYIGDATGQWREGGATSYVPGSRRWIAEIQLPDVDGTYYIVALQKVAQPSSTVPAWVQSQVAAATVALRRMPKIAVADSLVAEDLLCEAGRTDTLVIANEGDLPLQVTPTISGGAGITLQAPHNAPFAIAPRTSVKAVVRFAPTAAGRSEAELTLASNDPRTVKGVPQNSRLVRLVVNRKRVEPTLSSTAVDFGSRCVGTSRDTLIDLRYIGDVDADLIAIEGAGGAFQVLDPDAAVLPRGLGRNGRVSVRLRFQPTSEGRATATLAFRLRPCDTVVLLRLEGIGLASGLRVDRQTLDFGDVRIGTGADLETTVEVTAGSGVTITGVAFEPASGDLSVDRSVIGSQVTPGNPVKIRSTYAPSGATAIGSSRLCITLGGACESRICIPAIGRGVRSRLRFVPEALLLAADSCAEDPVDDVIRTLVLRNTGTAPETLAGIEASGDGVTISPRIAPGTVLGVGDSILLTVVWTPAAHGAFQERIVARIEGESEGVEIPLELRRNVVELELLDTGLAPLVGTIDIGDDFACNGPKLYPLRLRNNGTIPAGASLRFAVRSAFGLVSTTTGPILPDGDATIMVRFNPGAPGDYTDTLIATVGLCGTELRIPLRGRRHDLGYNVGSVNLGSSPIGVESRRVATFANTSSSPNNLGILISSVVIRNGGSDWRMSSGGFPRRVAPGEAATVEVAYTPSSAGSSSAQIVWTIEEPCPREVVVPLNGSGVTSSIVVRRRSLDFGARPFCSDSVLELTVENRGTSPVSIRNAQIGGPDAVAFQQQTTTAWPFPLPAGDSLLLRYRFSPSRATHEGLSLAQVTFTTDDPGAPSIDVDLVGERRRQILPSPSSVSFGTVRFGQSAEREIYFENRGEQEVAIGEIEVDPPFEIVPAQTTPTTLPPGGSLTLTVRYAPDDSARQSGRLLLRQSTPCGDSTLVLLDGVGAPVDGGVAAIALSRTVEGKPGGRVEIPVILTSARNLEAAGARSFHARVRIPRTALLFDCARAPWITPELARSGNDPSSSFTLSEEGGMRFVDLKVVWSRPPVVGDTLAVIDGVMLLGDSVSYLVAFDTAYWSDAAVKVTRRNGLVSLSGHCTVGGDRLVAIDGSFGLKYAAPTPFSGGTDIVFETTTDDLVTLTIVDPLGNVVATLVDRERLAPRPHAVRWEPDGLATGLYHALLTTPRRRSLLPLLYVR